MTRHQVRQSLAPSGLLALLIAGAASAGARGDGPHYGAAMNYRMHCEGCHQADGSGQPGFIPAFRGSVARFLATSEGRTYLARVPGTAQSLLSDAERAEVLNWIITTFDPDHMPSNFAPYTASELAPWRYDALSQPGAIRDKLALQLTSAAKPAPPLSSTDSAIPETTAAGEPPAAFGICSACHTVSKDGSNGVGPNLRGVVGRRAGTAAGFAYSPAMRGAQVTWTADQLEEYLKDPATKVPGNFMSIAGIPDAADRQSIIDYLVTLR
jgi:cytochrome c2